MKILDSTVLIAFLSEMDYPEGLRVLSLRHRLVIPQEVRNEIRRPPSSVRLQALIDEGVISVRAVNPSRLKALRDRFVDLGPGECACIVLYEGKADECVALVVTDDKAVRKRLPGCRYVWTRQLVRYMLQRGLIDAQRSEALMGRLAASTFYSDRG